MIGIGVIGYGYWGPNLARSFAEIEAGQITAIAEADAGRRAIAARRFPGATIVPDGASLIRNPRVDAVVIATPVRTHYELARAALLAGKHVLIEKPMTSSSTEAASLTDLAASLGLVLLVDHTFCFTPAITQLRDLVADGTLGELYYYISNRMNLGLFRPDIDVIWDLAVHDIAILYHCVTPRPIAISASGASHVRGQRVSMAHLTLFFETDLIADINVNWLSPIKIRQAILGGTERMVVYDDVEPTEKLKIYDSGVRLSEDPAEIQRMQISYRIGDMVAPRLDTSEALRCEAEHFIACIETATRPLTDAQMGLEVVEVLEAATRSLGRRGEPVEFRRFRAVS